MGISWTPQQQRVISLRNRNILVSAAAGSGKTAVLVQRIIEKITDKEKPVDLDKLLIVTFTNAAASEMRQRIGEAIEERIVQEPGNIHLLRQLTLIHHAPITTIHSFCLSIVRNYFHRIDLDPGFRIGDEGELKLLQEDVAEQLMECHYEMAEERFVSFVDLFATGKDDNGIAQMIQQLYQFSRSYPWPEKWLEECRKSYEVETQVQLNDTIWMTFFMEYYKQTLENYVNIYNEILELCGRVNGPNSYIPVFEKEAMAIRKAKEAQSYEEAWNQIRNIAFGRKPRKKKTDVFDARLEKRIVSLRDHVKNNIRAMEKSYFSRTPEQVAEDLRRAAPFVHVLIDLVEEFSQDYAKMKRKKNLVDFSDLEHLALDILMEEKDGEMIPSVVADQYSRNFDEIMIDEYQDSNYVQEMLIQSLSAERFGRPNVFMVGDVKQSIYKFRLAKPEIFMEKYKSYSEGDDAHQKIELHQNFRSRSSVLEGVNFIFYQIMKEQLGGITYTRETALHPGLTYECVEDVDHGSTGGPVECLLLDISETRLGVSEAVEFAEDEEEIKEEAEDEDDVTDREWEARMVGMRILQLIDSQNGQLVWDKEKGEYRPACLKDIVVLLRTMSGWSEPFVNTLMSMGISACAESKNGYFTTIEVRTILNVLRIIDNPMKDIPLAAVLHSPIGNFSSQELAWIKAACPSEMGGGLWQALQFFMEHQKSSHLYEKLYLFLTELDKFRDKASYMGIHDLLLDILQTTGYYDYASLMPGGERRKANLDMLLQKAQIYETISYQGVFQFVRYIEKLQKFEVNVGEASVIGEDENTVRIMSIHKSKGLEFPIVILAGCGKKFNKQETLQKVLMNSDFGVGIDAMNPELRTKTPTLMKKVLQKKIVLDNIGEELRILYVALTRAKEKLIMTGAKKNMVQWLDKRLEGADGDSISIEVLNQASSYLDFMIPALCHHQTFMPVWEKLQREAPIQNVWYNWKNMKQGPWNGLLSEDSSEYDNLFSVKLWNLQELSGQNKKREQERAMQKEQLYNWDTSKVWDKQFVKEMDKKFSYRYVYDSLSELHATMSVSELKKQSQEQEELAQLYPNFEEEKTLPRFMMEEVEEVSATRRGSLYHLVMEHLRYEAIMDTVQIRKQIDEMVAQGYLEEQEAIILSPRRIAKFFQSDVYKRMYQANTKGMLYREQRFIIAVSPEQINGLTKQKKENLVIDHKRSSHHFVMIQGIVDLYFEESDGVVLVDYKTDKISSEEELISRYETQLACYKIALEQMTNKKIKACYIYSFSMGKWIFVQ